MVNRRIFIRNTVTGVAGLALMSIYQVFGKTEDAFAQYVLPRSTPEQQGMSSSAIRNFLNSVQKSGLEFHSLMILRHGNVITEGWWTPYSAEHRQQLYSLSKSFTSTAIGFAVTEGLLSVEDPVIKFFPDELPGEISENLAALKVKHLLMMSVGHAKDSIMLLEASPTGVTWESITTDKEIIPLATGASATKVGSLIAGKIVSFYTVTGKMGLIKIDAVTGLADGTITYSVKVQE